MSQPTFTVPVADLDWGEKSAEWPITPAWLRRALEDTEARVRNDLPGRLTVKLTKNGREVLVRGRVVVPLEMDCARTLEPTPVDVDAELFLMLSPASDPVEAGVDLRRQERTRGPKKKRSKAELEDDEELTQTDANRDTFSGDQIVLDPLVREFILLELPAFPLRSEDSAAIAPSPREAGESDEQPVDPRLAPLRVLAERMRKG